MSDTVGGNNGCRAKVGRLRFVGEFVLVQRGIRQHTPPSGGVTARCRASCQEFGVVALSPRPIDGVQNSLGPDAVQPLLLRYRIAHTVSSLPATARFAHRSAKPVRPVTKGFPMQGVRPWLDEKTMHHPSTAEPLFPVEPQENAPSEFLLEKTKTKNDTRSVFHY